MLAGQTKNMFLTKTGIDIGALPVVLDVRVCTGYRREVDGSVRKEYAKELAPYPLQVCLGLPHLCFNQSKDSCVGLLTH